jgi:hypothetical protein
MGKAWEITTVGVYAERHWSASFMPCMEALDELQQAAAKNMAKLD